MYAAGEAGCINGKERARAVAVAMAGKTAVAGTRGSSNCSGSSSISSRQRCSSSGSAVSVTAETQWQATRHGQRAASVRTFAAVADTVDATAAAGGPAAAAGRKAGAAPRGVSSGRSSVRAAAALENLAGGRGRRSSQGNSRRKERGREQ